MALKKRRALAKDPLAMLIPDENEHEEEVLDEPIPEKPKKAKQVTAKKAKKPKPAKVSLKKERATFHLPKELIEAARNTVVALAGPPEYLTMAALAEKGLWKVIHLLEKKHNNGEPFSQRPFDLKGGRPIGS